MVNKAKRKEFMQKTQKRLKFKDKIYWLQPKNTTIKTYMGKYEEKTFSYTERS